MGRREHELSTALGGALPLDRLTSSTRVTSGYADEVETYEYNALGALKTNAGLSLDDQRPLLAGGGTADAAVPSSYNSVPISLDPGGRVTSLFGNTLAYNRRGRLISVTHPPAGGHTQAEYYAYDAQMRRIGRFGTVDGAASPTDYEYFVWDGANLVASIDNTNHVNESWLFEGVDQPLRLTTGGQRYYYELDLAGNVRRLRRTDGSDAGGYRYTAFGQEYTPSTAQVDQPLRWKARWWSDFSRLYDVRARWWSPEVGVFTSVDEFQFQDATTTLWGWPGQNPIAYGDRTGHYLNIIAGGVFGAVIGGVGSALNQAIDGGVWSWGRIGTAAAEGAAIGAAGAWNPWAGFALYVATNVKDENDLGKVGLGLLGVKLGEVGGSCPVDEGPAVPGGRSTGGVGAASRLEFPTRVVNSNMGHAQAQAVARAGFDTQAEAREALQEFGDGLENDGVLPDDAIVDPAHSDRVIVPGFGEGGAVVYQVTPDGVYKLKTVLKWRRPGS